LLRAFAIKVANLLFALAGGQSFFLRSEFFYG
jgi:hypothetical protein